MKRLITISLTAFLVLPLSAFAEIKTVTKMVRQPFGGSQSPDDARIAGIARAKREALEQFGTYIESTTVVKNSQLDSDDILALTAGVTKAEVATQKNYTDGDGFGLEISVKVELDTAVLEKSLKRMLEDRNHLKDLKEAREREKKLLAQIAELQKENQQKDKTEQQLAKLKERFHIASQGLTAVEWFEKGMNYGMASYEFSKNKDRYVFNKKYYSKAIKAFTQAILINPNFGLAYEKRAALYHGRGKYDEAIRDLNKAINLGQNNTCTYIMRGYAYYEKKRYPDAISDYSKVIELEPLPTYFNARGLIYEKYGQIDKAIADFEKAGGKSRFMITGCDVEAE